MKREFLGLSDDGYRVYKMWTPGEKGDCGIVMIVGYRDKDFMVYESEAWDDEVEQVRERTAQSQADQMRGMADFMRKVANGGGIPVITARAQSKSSVTEMVYGNFEAKLRHDLTRVLSFDSAPAVLFDDVYKMKPPALKPEQQGQPKRKPQPNRGPVGRKDWK